MNVRAAAVSNDDTIDAVIDAYVAWREERAAVNFAYRRWDRAPEPDRELAYAGYRAALDREERAAVEYRDLIERISAYRAPRCCGSASVGRAA